MQKFALEHIKSFEQSDEIELKPITIFVGKNSCGKSSLLRFPVVLAQTFREDALTPLLLFGNLIDYGNYEDVSYRHGNKPIGFKMTFGPEVRFYIKQRYRMMRYGYNGKMKEIFQIKNVDVQTYIDKPEKKLRVKEIVLYIEGRKLCAFIRKKDTYTVKLYQLFLEETWEDCNIEISSLDIKFYKFFPILNAEEFIKGYSEKEGILEENIETVPDNKYIFGATEYIENNVCKKEQYRVKTFLQTIYAIEAYFDGIRDCLRNEAEKIAYIGPFRETPKRTYRDSESSFNDVGVSGENASMILRQAAQGDRKLLENVSGWLQKTMGYSLDIQDVGNGLYSLIVCGKEESDNIIDVGFGISQVLPIVTQLFDRGEYRQAMYRGRMAERKTVIFEQPEIHLHPAAQAQLADLFVDCVSDKKGAVNRILIETHSEHLIRKLQVLVADPDIQISDDQVAIYYVDKDENGGSHIEKMELAENGQFEKAWPKGFFDKSYELTKMLMKANSKVPHQEKRND